jgi:hypothetical protein
MQKKALLSALLKPFPFNWKDSFSLNDQLSVKEKMIRDTTKAYCQNK